MKKGKMKTDRIWQAGLAFALLLLLCGCTKKEELLLLSEEAAGAVQDLSAFPQDAEGEMPTSGETERVTEGSQWGSDGENREYGMSAAAEKEAALQAQSGVIYVHVCGAVIKPGVYELEMGSRVYEAVQQAGGFAENAEQNYVNQAQVLDDGVKLVIPTQEEAAAVQERETVSPAGAAQDGALEKNGIVQAGREKELGIVGGLSADGKSAGEGADTGRTADGRININTASEAELCEIPGVGATRAAAIAAYRESHGAFGKPEDIMKVNGIKEGMYEKIKDSISVN